MEKYSQIIMHSAFCLHDIKQFVQNKTYPSHLIQKTHTCSTSPADVTSLFCNLMDNAIDACSIVDSPNITLRIGTDTVSNMDIITITNTCRSHPKFESNGLLATTKNNKLRHGFGMQSIQRVVDKYKRTLDAQYSEEDSLFQITINLYPGEKNNGYINL